jgi:hypothetical protein
MQPRRRTLAVYVIIAVAIVVLMAIPIWLGTGPAVLAPGIDP